MSPKLVVFDLDFTLWDAGGTWCDHLSQPFEIISGRIFDSMGTEPKLYPGTIDILEELKYEYIHCFDLILKRYRTDRHDLRQRMGRTS